jgi:hypothetical protein
MAPPCGQLKPDSRAAPHAGFRDRARWVRDTKPSFIYSVGRNKTQTKF